MLCCTSLLKRVLQPGDDKVMVFKKKMVTYCFSWLPLFIMATNARTLNPFCLPIVVTLFAVFAHLVLTKRLHDSHLEILLCVATINAFVSDWQLAALNQPRLWPLVVVFIDIALVCDLPQRSFLLLTVCTLIWLLVDSSEQAYRWGLYDAVPPVFISEKAETCDDPPCAVGPIVGLTGFFVHSVILLMDFYFTRGFAYDLKEEQLSMKHVIHTAERIAKSLSKFDLEAAESVLQTSPLPPPLHDAFTNILQNLHSYKPYLPQSCAVYEDGPRPSVDGCNENSCTNVLNDDGLLRSMSHSTTEVPMLGSASLEKKTVSYSVGNLRGSHVLAGSQRYLEVFSQYVDAVTTAVTAHRGVVGVLVGDRIHASFNAVRRCVGHARCAVDAALAVDAVLSEKGISIVTGISSGEAYCGSLGTRELMTFSIIGQVAVTASSLCRLGSSRNASIMCNATVYREITFASSLRLVVAHLTTTLPPRDPEDQVIAYELLIEYQSQKADEWMYEMKANPWEVYNRAGRALLAGNIGDAGAMLRLKEGGKKPPEVADAELWLQSVIDGRRGVEKMVL